MTSRLIAGLAAFVFAALLMPTSEALARCCGGSCCLIDDVCRDTGDTNPDNVCEVCDPSSAGTAWTAVADCTPDAGIEEDAGMSMEEDAGTSTETDAGTSTGTDAGTSTGTDSGTSTAMDGGPTSDDSGSDDGGCAAGGSGAFGGLFGLLLLGLRRKKGTL